MPLAMAMVYMRVTKDYIKETQITTYRVRLKMHQFSCIRHFYLLVINAPELVIGGSQVRLVCGSGERGCFLSLLLFFVVEVSPPRSYLWFKVGSHIIARSFRSPLSFATAETIGDDPSDCER